MFANAARHLGHAYVLSGRVEEGMGLLRRAADQIASSGHRIHQAQSLLYLSRAHLQVGELEPALTMAQQALTLAQECEQPPRQADALRMFGEIAVRREPIDADTAERSFREALALAETLEMRPLQAHCHLGLGKLYRRTGRHEEARDELETAVSMLREMGMTHWLPEAEAELAAC
jgi:tetratricopeptide (TPR) repeat protein